MRSFDPKSSRAIATRFVALLLLASPIASAFVVEGTVVTPQGSKVSDADVWLSQDRFVKHTKTDAQGAFAITEVAPKPAEIVARRAGFALGGMVVSVIGSGSIKVPLNEPDTLKLLIKDGAGEPLPGAYLRTMFVADSFNVPVDDLVSQGFPLIRSDEQGHMTVPELPKGTHVRFVIGHRDYADAQIAYLPIGGREQTILLYPGRKLRGRVTCEGKGVERARVVVSKLGAGAQRDAADTLTDPEGFYNATVKAGEYFVNVRHPDYASPKASHVLVKPDTEQTVADLALARPRAIDGSVVYPNGNPCSGVVISYWIGSDLYVEAITQADGHFRLLTPSEDGRIRIIPPNGYMTEILGDIVVKGTLEPETKLSPIKLAELPSVEGTVLGPDGKPQPGVLISSRTLTPPVWFITDSEGKFKIRLAQAPAEGTAGFRAEHAERFLRCDFQASFTQPAPVKATFAPFEPDASPREVKKGENDLSATMGSKAPEIECDHWFNSPPLTIRSLHGKVVVLAFWTAFDLRGPLLDCIEELRAMKDLLKDAQDVTFLCIQDNGTEVDEVQKSIERCGITFAMGRDTEKFATYQAYGIGSIPQIVLIDKHGVLRFFQTDGRLLELIKYLRREG